MRRIDWVYVGGLLMVAAFAVTMGLVIAIAAAPAQEPTPEPECVRIILVRPGVPWFVRNDTLVVKFQVPGVEPGWFCPPGMKPPTDEAPPTDARPVVRAR